MDTVEKYFNRFGRKKTNLLLKNKPSLRQQLKLCSGKLKNFLKTVISNLNTLFRKIFGFKIGSRFLTPFWHLLLKVVWHKYKY